MRPLTTRLRANHPVSNESMSKLPIEQILTAERTLCGAPASSKKRVLENVAEFICEDVTNLDPHELFSNLLARERLGSTGLGQGIALPHSRMKNCTGVIGSLVTLQQPIDFESVDDQPVDILFVLIAPEEATQEHLNTLAALAERFSDPGYCRALRAANNNRALYEAAITASWD